MGLEETVVGWEGTSMGGVGWEGDVGREGLSGMGCERTGGWEEMG